MRTLVVLLVIMMSQHVLAQPIKKYDHQAFWSLTADKPSVVIFSTSNCVFCDRLKSELNNAFKNGRLENAKLVNIWEIKAEASSPGYREFIRRVGIQGFPATFAYHVDKDGVKHKQKTALRGYVPAEEFNEFLRKVLEEASGK